jgi:hypothetical protein
MANLTDMFSTQALGSYFPPEDELSVSTIHEKWNELVGDYSARLLTFHEDRLVALAGIASRFAERCSFEPTEYLAGLWMKTVILDLLWYSREPKVLDSSIPWTAPSWSWASVVGEVGWQSDPWDKDPIAATGAFLGAEVEVKHSELPFSAVKSGRLHIAGPVSEAVLDLPSDTVTVDFVHPSSVLKHSVTLYPDRQHFGEQPGLPKKLTVCFLELTSRVYEERADNFTSYTGMRRGLLLLRRSGRKNEFYRVGLYEQSVPLEGDSETFPESCAQCLKNLGALNTNVLIT